MSLLSLRKVEVPDIRYRADMELHDRFQEFSAELLKLSLAGIAAVGFFLTAINTDNGIFTGVIHSKLFLGFIVSSVVMFLVSVGAALGHRFLASDGMFHHLRAIKYIIVRENIDQHVDLLGKPESKTSLDEYAKNEEHLRNMKFLWSERFLRTSGVTLVLGAISLGASFVVLLLRVKS